MKAKLKGEFCEIVSVYRLTAKGTEIRREKDSINLLLLTKTLGTKVSAHHINRKNLRST
jgi:hypothetical protein